MYVSVVSFGEIRKGLAKLPKSHRKQDLTCWVDMLLNDYQARILPIELAVAENWGILLAHADQSGRPLPSVDGLIAATAYTHNLTLATRNESDFASARIPVFNPWN